MAAPTLVATYAPASGNFSSTTTPKTATSVSVQTGDVLVAVGETSDSSTSLSVSGGGLTWTQVGPATFSGYCWVSIWSATATSTTSFTVTATASNSSNYNGLVVQVWRGSTGVGASVTGTQTSPNVPTLALTTTADSSAIVFVAGDWAAVDGASRTYDTINGSTGTEQAYYYNGSWHTVYVNTWLDAGAAGSKTVGLAAPTGQVWAAATLEVKGSTGSDATVTPSTVAGSATIGAPTVTVQVSRTATPTTVAGAVSVATPTVVTSGNATVGPSVVTATATITAPTVTTGSGTTVTPTTVQAVVTIDPSTGAVAETVTPSTVAGSATIPAPSVQTAGNTTASPTTVAAVVTIGSPTVSAPANASASPSVVAGSVTVGAPTISTSTGATASPPAVAGVVTIVAPTVSTGAGATVTPSTVGGAASVGDPALVADLSVTVGPSTVTATVTVGSPGVTAVEPTWILTPPTAQRRYGDDPMWGRIWHTVGLAIVVYGDGRVETVVEGPSIDGVDVVDVWPGGRDYEITAEQAEVLTDAGYADYLQGVAL